MTNLKKYIAAVVLSFSFFASMLVLPAVFAATNPIPTVIALFETSLASGITIASTSMTLVSSTDKDGNSLNGTYAFILDEGTANEEFVNADCVANSCTNMTRGLSVVTGTTSINALKKEHRRGSSVKITDAPALLIMNRIISGISTFPNIISYTTHPTFTSDTQLVDLKQLNDTAIAGGVNASTSTKGISKLSVAAASSTNPIVVGDNDPRVPPVNTSTITLGQVQALAGTSGVPSSTNKYVTDADTSSTSTAGTLVRFTASSTLPDAQNLYTTLTAGETIAANAPVAAGYYLSDGGIQLDTKTVATSITGSLTKSVTVGANSNRIMLATFQLSSGTITGVTYSGVAMTLISGASVTANSNYVYYILAPATGANNLIATYSGAVNSAVSVSSYYNVSQTSTLDAVAKANNGGGSSATASTTITTVSDGTMLYVAGTILSNAAGTFSVPPYQNTAFAPSGGNQVATIGGDNGFVIPADQTSVTLTGTGSVSTTVFLGIVALKPVTSPTYDYVVNASSALSSSYSTVTTTPFRSIAFMGFATNAATSTNTIRIQTAGVLASSGLTQFRNYYLGDTPGTISTATGTITRKVGITLNTNKLLITNIW